MKRTKPNYSKRPLNSNVIYFDRGPHRALHMCAFQLGLYALGLHNRVQPNWVTRTYSSHVSWITGEVFFCHITSLNFFL